MCGHRLVVYMTDMYLLTFWGLKGQGLGIGLSLALQMAFPSLLLLGAIPEQPCAGGSVSQGLLCTRNLSDWVDGVEWRTAGTGAP